ncbi:Hypothetical Protein FCC1311_044972 [Hondaea fermentalgiana]|uniref:Uncharacterized protein n=1 Tax=Hondaea fermentalgiana TaxID=2315210 RepID=A0A2R5GK80_9STRA|nr:Hypothetical Protein FCC1311_044972 [Hondaea fermentalgiana]|eukprot:GBG28274.1 Hypothetical Protein FCC1311_044972 [Hondaea fermentalgiana]
MPTGSLRAKLSSASASLRSVPSFDVGALRSLRTGVGGGSGSGGGGSNAESPRSLNSTMSGSEKGDPDTGRNSRKEGLAHRYSVGAVDAIQGSLDDLSILGTTSAPSDDDDDDAETASLDSGSLAPSRSQSFAGPKSPMKKASSRRVSLRVHHRGVKPRLAFPEPTELDAIEDKASKNASGWKAWIKGHRRAVADDSHWVSYIFREAPRRDVVSFNEDEVMALLRSHLSQTQSPNADVELATMDRPFDLGSVEFPQGWGLLECNNVSLRGLSSSEALCLLSVARQRTAYRLVLCSPFVVSILKHGHFRQIASLDGAESHGHLMLLCMLFLEKHATTRWHLFAESANINASDASFVELQSALLRVTQYGGMRSPLHLENVFASRRDDHVVTVCRLLNVSIASALAPADGGPLINIDMHDLFLADEDEGPRQVLEAVLARSRDVLSLLSVFTFIRRLSSTDEEAAIFFCCSLAPLIMEPEDPGLLRRLGKEAARITYESEAAQTLYPLAGALSRRICSSPLSDADSVANSAAIVSALLGDPVTVNGRSVTEVEASAHLASQTFDSIESLDKAWAASLLGALVRHKLAEPLISPYLYRELLLVALTNDGDQVDCNYMLRRLLAHAATPRQRCVLSSLCKVINYLSEAVDAIMSAQLVKVFAPCVLAPAAFPLTRREHIEIIQRDRDAIVAVFSVMLRFSDYIFGDEDGNKIGNEESSASQTSSSQASSFAASRWPPQPTLPSSSSPHVTAAGASADDVGSGASTHMKSKLGSRDTAAIMAYFSPE